MIRLSQLHLSHTPIAFSEVTGKGKGKDKGQAYVRLKMLVAGGHQIFLAEDADVTLRLYLLFKSKLAEAKKRGVYESLGAAAGDARVLADMERAGVTIEPGTAAPRLPIDFGKTPSRA